MSIDHTKNKGVTLIELVVAIALVGLIVLMAFNLQLFGQRIFSKGEAKYDVQSNLRLDSNFIVDKVRFASKVVILTGKPASFDPIKQYIYSEAGALKYYAGGTVKALPGYSSGIAKSLVFEDVDSQTVKLSVDGVKKGEQYQIETIVNLLNIGEDVLAPNTGAALEFQDGIAFDTNSNDILANSVVINTVPVGTTGIGTTSTVEFGATVLPVGAAQSVRWEVDSASSSFAVISAAGILTVTAAPNNHVIQVRATSLDGSGTFSAWYSVTAITAANTDIKVSGIVVNSSRSTLPKKGSLTMTATVSPANATNKSVVWSIQSGPGRITTGGVLTNNGGFKDAVIVIKATASDGYGIFGTKSITIVN